ncbi:flagellar assembly factor FliW [Synergistales bacterium]|nr:flagellar assembly factor FliW [Synergistales bacterium]
MTQTVTSSRFGEISYTEEDVLFFPRGLPAFEKNHNWILAGEEDSAIKWLQNIEEGDLALPVTTPDAVMPDYNARIPEDDLNLVGSIDPQDLALLIVASIPDSAPWNMTANLRAPILINMKSHKAVQVIALNEEYPIHHVVFPENVRESMKNEAVKTAALEGEAV